jgi:hypothetical protein
MWNETVVAWHDILQKVRKATELQNHSYSERVEPRAPRIEEQNVNNNKENVTDVHKNISVYSVMWYLCTKFQRCPLPPSVCIYPNDGASTHVSHTSGRNLKDKNSLVYVRFTFCFPVDVSGLCFHVHRRENVQSHILYIKISKTTAFCR